MAQLAGLGFTAASESNTYDVTGIFDPYNGQMSNYGGGFDWQSLVGAAANTGLKIAQARYGTDPNMVYQQRTAQGTVTVRQPSGGSPVSSLVPAIGTGAVGSSLPWIIGGVAVLVVMAAAFKR